MAEVAHFLKNVSFSEVTNLSGMVDYQEGRVVSRTFFQSPLMSVTLFAFAKGEGLSAHTAAGDALVHILDGEASITVGEKDFTVKAGEVIAMPAGIPHALHASVPFKMFLVVVKGS